MPKRDTSRVDNLLASMNADLLGRELRDLFGEALETRLHEALASNSPRVPTVLTDTVLGATFAVRASPLDSDDGLPAGIVLVLREP